MINAQLANAIRDAFASGEFAKAQRLWGDYAEQLRQSIGAGTATAAMLAETRELIDWSALRVKVHRAHAAHQLTGLYLAGFYQEPKPDRPVGIRVSF